MKLNLFIQKHEHHQQKMFIVKCIPQLNFSKGYPYLVFGFRQLENKNFAIM